MHAVEVVVEAEDGHAVLGEESLLGLEDGVVADVVDGVFVLEEGGLVRDEEVRARGLRALAHVEGGHHGGRDAVHLCIVSTDDEAVDGRRAPGDAEVLLHAVKDGGDGEGGGGGGLCGRLHGQEGGSASEAGGGEEVAAGKGHNRILSIILDALPAFS